MTLGSSHFYKSNNSGAQEEDHLFVSEGCGTGKDRGERRGRGGMSEGTRKTAVHRRESCQAVISLYIQSEGMSAWPKCSNQHEICICLQGR